MLEYRFFIRGSDDSIEGTQIYLHRDDVSALEHARTLLVDHVGGQVIEGWHEARRVFRLLPDGSAGV